MRPLSHPSVDDITVEGILHALSDPVRVAIFADLVRSGYLQNCSTWHGLAQQTIPKSTLSQHFKILREAGLVRAERHGVEMRNSSRCAEIEARFPGLISAIVNAHDIQMRDKAQKNKPSKSKRKQSGPHDPVMVNSASTT